MYHFSRDTNDEKYINSLNNKENVNENIKSIDKIWKKMERFHYNGRKLLATTNKKRKVINRKEKFLI